MIHPLQTLNLVIYLFALLALFIYGMNCYLLMLFYIFKKPAAFRRHERLKEDYYRNHPMRDWPRVTVQLPIFNERYVIDRLLESVCGLDYPRELLEIQILDDSTDVTAAIARELAANMNDRGIDVHYIHRKRRIGYKAGSLKNGLKTAKGELLAIFDADFVPRPDFLKETIPYFTDPETGMLQARWGHINSDYSLLTRAQSIGIDGHFGVEQAARAWSGWFMNFNGTAGIWRKTTIEDAGGWQTDTLTEDLDLSYRAQLSGWKLKFASEVVCPAEVPVTINAFKSQQHRWAKGSIQTARKNLGGLFKADIPRLVKLQAFLHLTHYMVHPMMILVVLTSIPLLYSQWFFSELHFPVMIFTVLCLATFGPTSMYFFSQKILYRDWKNRIKFLPMLLFLGTGIAANNTKAVLEALLNVPSGFIRTPKYGIRERQDRWRGKKYTIPLRSIALLEFLLGAYSLTGLLMFLFFDKYLVSPFLFIYTSGFFYVFFLSVKHGYRQK